MKLDNHIAYRFLMDDMLPMEIIQRTYPDVDMDDYTENPRTFNLANLLFNIRQKSYYCTQSMLDKLDHLKVKRKDGVFDWTVFAGLSERKVTFIFPENCLLRMLISADTIQFIHCTMVPDKDKKWGNLKWVMFYVNRVTGEQCDHFEHIDVKTIEEFVYKLLCFMYLTENDEVELGPGKKTGTKKSGKIINTLKFPLTIVTSRWNTTTINNNKFMVRGHFSIRWTGAGRTNPKIVWIDPFTKNGYTRTAKSLSDDPKPKNH